MGSKLRSPINASAFHRAVGRVTSNFVAPDKFIFAVKSEMVCTRHLAGGLSSISIDCAHIWSSLDEVCSSFPSLPFYTARVALLAHSFQLFSKIDNKIAEEVRGGGLDSASLLKFLKVF
jgi:hypothetical protein